MWAFEVEAPPPSQMVVSIAHVLVCFSSSLLLPSPFFQTRPRPFTHPHTRPLPAGVTVGGEKTVDIKLLPVLVLYWCVCRWDGGARVFQWEKSSKKQRGTEKAKKKRKKSNGREFHQRSASPLRKRGCVPCFQAPRAIVRRIFQRGGGGRSFGDSDRRGEVGPSQQDGANVLCCTKARKQTCSTISRPSISLLVVLSGNLPLFISNFQLLHIALPKDWGRLPAGYFISNGRKVVSTSFYRGGQEEDAGSRERKAMLKTVVMGGRAHLGCCWPTP